MNLGDLWGWEKRKLGCRIRAETQNPALDEIRERLSKMSGALRTGRVRDELSRPTTAALGDGAAGGLTASSTAALVAYQRDALPKEISKTRKNINKKFFQIPGAPGEDHARPPEGPAPAAAADGGGDAPREPGEAPPVAVGAMRPKTTGGAGGRSGTNRRGLPDKARSAARAEEEERLRLSVPAKRDDPKAHEAKLHCANSLASWSTHAENAARLAEEGAVSAALVLSKDENADVRRACATAFKNMSQHAELCAQLVKHTAVPVISDLGVAAKDIAVSRDCGLALVNLTIMDGIEAKLVEDGVVIALMSLMNQHEELAELCSRGLFNLTCVDQPYMYMERVIKAFVSLASSTMAAVKHVCAAALCNLSDIKAVRSRIVEEGVVQVVGLLARGAEARTRRVCAIVLHSLASTRTCRADMVSKGAVQVLYALSSDVDTITLHYIASAIIRLAMEDQNLPRLVHEGGVTALCNICLRCPRDVSTTQLCASALSLLSQQAIGRQAIVQEGCVPALVTLLHEASDASTLRHGLSALTNLLVDEGNHEQVLGQGGVASVIALCSHASSEIREACARALQLQPGEARERACPLAIPAIIALSRLPEPRTRMRCAATLCKLASVEANAGLMVEEGVEAIVKQGGVAALMMICMVRAVSHLTKQVCAKALLNLLCTPAVRENWLPALAKEGLVQACSVLSRLSEEETMRVCASIFCTLSAQGPAGRALLVERRSTLLDVFGLMRSRDRTTQVVCGKTACNLLGHVDSQQPAVRAGAVSVLTSLCTLGDPEAEVAAADAYFLIAGDEACRLEMVEAKVLPVLITNARSPNGPTRQSCLRVLAHLAWWKNRAGKEWKNVRAPLLTASIVPVLVVLVEQTCGAAAALEAEPAGDADAAAPAAAPADEAAATTPPRT
ncbi:ubiquitin-protein transferase [Aureococcus anophagefferens]|nr:ubiquitin-protein transferase [Aureococcus anophagefferens]